METEFALAQELKDSLLDKVRAESLGPSEGSKEFLLLLQSIS